MVIVLGVCVVVVWVPLQAVQVGGRG